MLTYYVTFAIVIGACFLAEYYDYSYDNSISYGRVRHTGFSLLFYSVAIGALSWVAGSRHYVGTDFGAYFNENCSWVDVVDKLTHFEEPGFFFLSYLGRSVWNTGQANIMIAAFATIIPAMIVLYRNTDKLVIVAFMFSVACWDGCFNGVRQYLAATVLFLGFSFIRDKKLWKYAVTVFAASLCHRSAVVMIVPYFIVHWKVDWKKLLLIIIGTLIILFTYEKLFDLAGWVLDEEGGERDAYRLTEVNRWRVLAGCVPAVFFIVAYWKKQKSDAENFYINLLIIHAAVRVVTMNSAFLYRVGIYTALFQAIAIPELLKGFSEKDRRIITPIILILFGILWWWEVRNSSSLNPFRWYW